MSTTAFPCCKDTTFKRIIRISLTFDYNIIQEFVDYVYLYGKIGKKYERIIQAMSRGQSGHIGIGKMPEQ